MGVGGQLGRVASSAVDYVKVIEYNSIITVYTDLDLVYCVVYKEIYLKVANGQI